MRVLNAPDLLDAWERGQAQLPAERAVTLLTLAGMATEEAASVPLGRRDTQLLALRERLFGPQVVAVVDCGSCGDSIEADFTTSDVRVDGDGERPAPRLHLASDGYSITFRLPVTADVLAAAQDGGSDGADVLLGRCIERAEYGGKAVAVAELPMTCRNDVAVAMAAADPQAEVELAISCPSCGAQSPRLFDVAGFVWRELSAWAERTLTEVHALARSYGWREADVLAMSAFRRRRYLELAGP